jgi:hypothetical protein
VGVARQERGDARVEPGQGAADGVALEVHEAPGPQREPVLDVDVEPDLRHHEDVGMRRPQRAEHRGGRRVVQPVLPHELAAVQVEPLGPAEADRVAAHAEVGGERAHDPHGARGGHHDPEPRRPRSGERRAHPRRRGPVGPQERPVDVRGQQPGGQRACS